jgi:RimJ/RimL family protein N-acetyltransferase
VAMAVVDAAGKFLGSVDLRDLDRRRGVAEIGYWSAPWARGRRVSEHAARALLSWGFEHLGLVRVDWRATVGNHASRLVGLRLGFRVIGIRPGPVDEWIAALVPSDLTEAGHEPEPAVRRQAKVFGAEPPTLRAGPATLRPPSESDRAAIEVAYADPESERWYGGGDPLRDAPREWARGTEAVFAVTDGDDNWVGTADIRVDPRDPAIGEVGFLIAPEARGRGYATAAVRELVRWGFAELGLERIQWRAEVGNRSSRRVAEKAGFTMEGLLRQSLAEDGRRYDCWVGSMLSTDEAAT